MYYLLTLLFSHSPQSPFLPGVGWGRAEVRRSSKVSVLPSEKGGVTQLAGLVGFYFPGERVLVPAGGALSLDMVTTRAVSPGGLSSNATCSSRPPAALSPAPTPQPQNRRRLWIWEHPHPLVFPSSVLIIQPAIIAGVKLNAQDREKH